MNVRKRSGKVVPFDAEFIRRAVTLAAAAAGEHDPDGVDRVTEAVQARLEAAGQDIVDIERIQDTVEETLFQQQFYRTAKNYILYRVQKEKERASGQWQEGILTREFLSPYKHAPNPWNSWVPSSTPAPIPAICPSRAGGNSGGKRCAGRWSTMPPWPLLPGKKLKNSTTTSTICGSFVGPHPVGGGYAGGGKIPHGQLQLRFHRHQ